MDLLSLPCQRRRHGSCAGRFTLGVGRYAREHQCVCKCHFWSDVARLLGSLEHEPV